MTKKELIKHVKENTIFSNAECLDSASATVFTLPFGEPSNENAASLHITDTTVEVGLYDYYNEHSIYKLPLAQYETILAIAEHIYNKNNY